jgi:hypothetical protein
MQPALVLAGAATDDVEEGVLEGRRDRAAAAGADLTVVDLADGGDFGGGAGQEDLVGHVELVAGDRDLADGHALVARDLDHRGAGDAFEDVGSRGRLDLAVAHDEEILAARLGHEAGGVEQDRLVVAVEQRFALGEDRVHVVAAGLALLHLGVDVVAREARHAAADAALHALLAQVLAPRPGDHRHAHRVVGGMEAHHAVADEGERPDVALGEAVLAQRVEHGLGDDLARERDRHQVDVRGLEEPAHVLGQAEHRGAAVVGAVAADALEHAEAVVQRVGQHVHARLVPRNHAAVEPDPLTVEARHVLRS